MVQWFTQMRDVPSFDADLLRRYDRAGPRYTSYPTAPQFHGDFDAASYREQARRSNAHSPARALSLYVHIPFCRSPCLYCGCNRIITRDQGRAERYVAGLEREIGLVAPLFARARTVVQLHLGGGTPNFLSSASLGALLACLAHHFRLSEAPDRDFSIELDPRFIEAGYVAQLARLGFNRASLGVQDFDPAVQRAVNRAQSIAQTRTVIEDCRAAGFRSINIDLIYGLPRQTPAGFASTLSEVIAARPERLAIYAYAHMPRLFKAQRRIDPAELPDREGRIALLRLAIETLRAAGYRYIGMDHFALPEDDLARSQADGGLQRNFMGYTTHGNCDLIGLGMSAISHIGDSFGQNFRELRSWEAALERDELPVWRGRVLDLDDVLRADIIQRLMCQGEIDLRAVERRYGIQFASYFRSALQQLAPLAADALVELDRERLRVTARGRLLLRIVAMCFDRYLPQTAAVTPELYSKVV